MGQGTSGLVSGKADKADATLEFEPGHKIFAQNEKKRFKGISFYSLNADTFWNFMKN